MRAFAREQQVSRRTLERIKRTLAIRSVRAPDGDRRSTFWLLPGQLPERATEEMLVPVETREELAQACQAEIHEYLHAFMRRPDDKGTADSGGAGRRS